jgi:hypothetical protein
MKLPLALGAILLVACFSRIAAAECAPCVVAAPYVAECHEIDAPPSWIFRRSTYSHDPYTGARVAQYMRTPPVEPLDDERMITSRYHRKRTNLRGHDGSNDTYYEVQHWGNGRGGLDAEWERFHDAWKESILSGGFYNQSQGYGPWGYGGGYGSGVPGFGFPMYGFPPGNYYGQPPYGGAWHGNHGHGGHHGGGHHGGGGHGGGDHGGGHAGGHGDD